MERGEALAPSTRRRAPRLAIAIWNAPRTIDAQLSHVNVDAKRNPISTIADLSAGFERTRSRPLAIAR
jgi:hypothetical protein